MLRKLTAVMLVLGWSVPSLAADPAWFDRADATFVAGVLEGRVDAFLNDVLDEMPSEVDLVRGSYDALDAARTLHEGLRDGLDFEIALTPAHEDLEEMLDDLDHLWEDVATDASADLVSSHDAVRLWWEQLVAEFLGPQPLLCARTSRSHYLPQLPSGGWIGGRDGYGFSSFSRCQQAIDDEANSMLCSWTSRSYLPYNTRDGAELGGDADGWGFSSYARCKDAIDDATTGIVCSWTGRSYLPYTVETGVQLGGDADGWGFSSYSRCRTAVEDATDRVICSWTGRSYLPYVLEDGVALGGTEDGWGFSSYNACNDAVAAATEDLMCSWNGHGYRPYAIDGGHPMGPVDQEGAFSSRNRCDEAIGGQTNGLVCSWTGHSYLPHRVKDGARIGNEEGWGFSSMSRCQEALDGSTARYVCSWTGQDYGLYRSRNGTLVSTYSSQSRCQSAIPAS